MLATRTLRFFTHKSQTRTFFSLSSYAFLESVLRRWKDTRMKMFGKRRKSISTTSWRSFRDGFSHSILMMQAWTQTMKMINRCFKCPMMFDWEPDSQENSTLVRIQYVRFLTMCSEQFAILQVCFHQDLKVIRRYLMPIMVWRVSSLRALKCESIQRALSNKKLWIVRIHPCNLSLQEASPNT